MSIINIVKKQFHKAPVTKVDNKISKVELSSEEKEAYRRWRHFEHAALKWAEVRNFNPDNVENYEFLDAVWKHRICPRLKVLELRYKDIRDAG